MAFGQSRRQRLVRRKTFPPHNPQQRPPCDRTIASEALISNPTFHGHFRLAVRKVSCSMLTRSSTWLSMGGACFHAIVDVPMSSHLNSRLLNRNILLLLLPIQISPPHTPPTSPTNPSLLPRTSHRTHCQSQSNKAHTRTPTRNPSTFRKQPIADCCSNELSRKHT